MEILPLGERRIWWGAVRVPFPLLVFFAALGIGMGLARGASAKSSGGSVGDPQRLEVPGQSDAFYYRPRGKGQKPVIIYLHGRGGNPEEDCRKWAKVATQFGWVLCPQGPDDQGGGARSWANNPTAGKEIVDSSLFALREKYKHRVQTRGNILVGFSEGAFIAMQVGLRDPKTWSRWLILAANDQYWWGDAAGLLHDNHRSIRRVYLLTGENDEVAENTTRVGEMVKAERIPVRVKIAPGMGHEVPGDRMVSTYRRPLLWLSSH
jgi:predicted esterase